MQDPSTSDWASLSRYDNTLTRRTFETRLNTLWDPEHAMAAYLAVTDTCVKIYEKKNNVRLLAVVRFAPDNAHTQPNPHPFRGPEDYRKTKRDPAKPLSGLKIAIDPADIGGKWAKMEDRSVHFKGYGLINEGDLNIIVGKLLKERLENLGATVCLARDTNTPVLRTTPEHLIAQARLLAREPGDATPSAMENLVKAVREGKQWDIQRQANILYTKTLESRAREKRIRQNLSPDFTIILQHNATPESGEGKLTRLENRNIFFVSGMYRAAGLTGEANRYYLLRKLFANVTPTEVAVAEAISARFKARTGYAPVMYGNSETTRLVREGNDYVVARNLMFTREHDGPTIVTEPYFMNQPITIARLLAGDYEGRKTIAGAPRGSIFREYADCVAEGILEAYR